MLGEPEQIVVNLKCDLPASVRQSLAIQLGPDSQVEYAVESDLTQERHYGTSYVIVTATHLVAADAGSHSRHSPGQGEGGPAG